jgi:hypothetical protein
MATVTASYYHMSKVANSVSMNGLEDAFEDVIPNGSHTTALTDGINADAFWLDIAIADKDFPMGLTAGIQAGMIKPDSKAKNSLVSTVDDDGVLTVAGQLGATLGDLELDDTKVYGAKIGLKPMDALSLGLAYTSVSGEDDKITVAAKNVGTGIKTPLYTQMIANQDMISQGAKTFVASASYSLGDMGTIGLAYGDTAAKEGNLRGEDNDYNELDVTYKINAGGVQYFAGYVRGDFKADDSDFDIVRIWARYNF